MHIFSDITLLPLRFVEMTHMITDVQQTREGSSPITRWALEVKIQHVLSEFPSGFSLTDLKKS